MSSYAYLKGYFILCPHCHHDNLTSVEQQLDEIEFFTCEKCKWRFRFHVGINSVGKPLPPEKKKRTGPLHLVELCLIKVVPQKDGTDRKIIKADHVVQYKSEKEALRSYRWLDTDWLSSTKKG